MFVVHSWRRQRARLRRLASPAPARRAPLRLCRAPVRPWRAPAPALLAAKGGVMRLGRLLLVLLLVVASSSALLSLLLAAHPLGGSHGRAQRPRRAGGSAAAARPSVGAVRGRGRRGAQMAHLESLVVVAGHAVYVGHDFSPQRAEDNEAWFLEVGMRGRGRARRCCKAARPKAPCCVGWCT